VGLDGILLVDKEQDWTSHDVVAKARSITGQRRIGHTGTLDPMATGLLVLCLGQATRLVEYMTRHDKQYQGEITLGVATSTDDTAGEVLTTCAPPKLDAAALRALERRFRGEILQRPPAFSAVKVHGQRAYAAAHKGAPLDIPERLVSVHELALAQAQPGVLSLRIHCGPGTYVRSIARDIGAVLGCGATLSSLRRLAVGSYSVESACNLGFLAQVAGEGRLENVLRAPDDGVLGHNAAIVSTENAARLRHGRTTQISDPGFRPASTARVYTTDGDFVAMADVTPGGQIHPVKVFAH